MDPTNEIIVTNIQDNDTVYHAVLVIEGKIIQPACERNEIEEFIVWNNGEKQNNHRMKDNHFKILVELKVDINHITINYCDIVYNMTINYEISNLERSILPLYIINKNHDGQFQSPNGNRSPESACKRIYTGTKLLQCIIAQRLQEDHHNWKTFKLQSCQIFYSDIECSVARKMKQDDLWAAIGREIMNSKIGNTKTKYLGFLSCTRYKGGVDKIHTYEDMINATEAHVALGGGGLALFGSACLYTWPDSVDRVLSKFEDTTMVDTAKYMNDSCFRNTFGGCFSTTLGSVLHELCHTFDLGHTEDGIMGRGFDNMDNFFLMEQSPRKLPQIRTTGDYTIRYPNNHTDHFIKSIKTAEPYFTGSCSAVLNYHKFFNNVDTAKRILLTFDPTNNIVRSTAGIRVVEIRQQLTELVLHSWTFSGKVLKYSFQLPSDYCRNIIVIEDNHGNIIKEAV